MTHKPTMHFGILLRVPDEATHKVYGLYGKMLQIENGLFVRITSEQPDVFGHFLQVRLIQPPKRRGLTVWIPIQYVVLILSDHRPGKIGFVEC